MKKISLVVLLLCFPTSLKVFSTESVPSPQLIAGVMNTADTTTNTATLPNRTSKNGQQAVTMEKEQVAHILVQAGFPKQVVPLVTCLAEHESHFKPNAVNENVNHTRDYGLMQVNSVWLKGCKTTAHRLLNPIQNAQCAFQIYQTQGLTAWTTYKAFKNTCLAYHVDGFNNEDVIADSKLANKQDDKLM